MNLGQVDVENIFGTVVILDLAAGPVKAFDLYGLAVLDGATEWDWSGSVGGSTRGNINSTVGVPPVL